MTVVSPSQSNAGETIEASDINNPVNQLAAVINGNIDATNIADNSITTAKVAAGLPITKFANTYNFSVYRNAAYSTVAAIATKVPFDARYFDTSSNYDITTNNRFTAPVAGYYAFTAGLALGSTTARVILMLYKNGVEEQRIFDNSSSGAFLTGGTGAGYVKLAANDYIELWYFTTNSGLAVTTSRVTTYFNGYMVSAT